MKNIGEELKRIRKLRGITQRELADAVGVAPSTISGYELGTRVPEYAILEKISKKLNISIFEFLDDSGASDFLRRYAEYEKLIRKIAALDDVDRGRISERIDMMLESEKYNPYKKVI